MRLPPWPLLYYAVKASVVMAFIPLMVLDLLCRGFGGRGVLQGRCVLVASGEHSRVIQRYLLLPVIRHDEAGYEWLCTRSVYQYELWGGGSGGGMYWESLYTLPQKGRLDWE